MLKIAIYNNTINIRTTEGEKGILFSLGDIVNNLHLNRTTVERQLYNINAEKHYIYVEKSKVQQVFFYQMDLVKALLKTSTSSNDFIQWLMYYKRQENIEVPANNNVVALKPIDSKENPFINMSKVELLEQIINFANEALLQARQNSELEKQNTQVKSVFAQFKNIFA